MTSEDWTCGRFTLESLKIRGEWDALPNDQKTTQNLMTLVAYFPENYQAPALALLQCGSDAKFIALRKLNLDHKQAMEKINVANANAIREWQREGRAFWCGVILLLVALAWSTLLPPSNPSTSLTLRVVTALAVALIIAFLPGLFSIDSKINIKSSKVVIRATGGIAGFVMVYLFDPAWLSSLLSFHKK